LNPDKLPGTTTINYQVPENGSIASLPFQKGATGAEVPFHNSTIGNFMVYQGRLDANLLQLFAHPESSQWFSTISVIIFEVDIVA